MTLAHNIIRLLPRSKNEKRTRAAIAEWFTATTIDDVYGQFLSTAMSPCWIRQCVPRDLLTPTAIGHFDAIVSTFPIAPNGELHPSDVFDFLSQAKPNQSLLIQMALPQLTTLLFAHARFPFSEPVPLTRDALLRAVMLLTHRGTQFFAYAAHYDTPRFADGDWLAYIANALAVPGPPQGAVAQYRIVELLVRLPFPLPSSPKKTSWPPRHHFEAMAERLHPPRTPSGNGPYEPSSSNLQSLAELVAALMSNKEEEPLEAQGRRAPSAATARWSTDQFVAWGFQVQLLDALHKLFEPMLPSCEQIGQRGSSVARARSGMMGQVVTGVPWEEVCRNESEQ